jgi:methylenetetrahydrofolate reductase (NADPH)
MHIGQMIKTQKKPFYSLEFFPPKEKEKWDDFFAIVQKLKTINPLFASVTCGAGGTGQGYTVDIAGKIKNDHAIECMAHCTCVRSNIESMNQYFEDLKGVGIDNILALRGDRPKNEDGLIDESLISDDFKYAEDLVRYSKKAYPSFGVAVAAYPAPHPESKSFADDRKYLIQKIRAGADFGVTQLFFDSREYMDLLEILRREKLECPIIPGILPIQSLASIKHTLSLCGANIPGKFFLELEDAHEKGGTEKVKEVGLKYAVEQIRMLVDAGAPGIHLYTLNRADLCLQLVDMV